MRLKLIICLFIGFLVSESCISDVSGKENLEIKVRILKKLNSDSFKAYSGDFYKVSINLKNNTGANLSFWTMTCSWEQNWISNTSSMYLFNEGCDSNYPYIVQIKKSKTLSLEGIIRVMDKTKIGKNLIFKLGFVLIKEEELKDQTGFMHLLVKKGESGENVFWSEPFRIEI